MHSGQLPTKPAPIALAWTLVELCLLELEADLLVRFAVS